MNRNIFEARPVMLNGTIVQLPIFVDIKMCIAASPCPGIKRVRQNVARPIKFISIAVILPESDASK